MMLVSLWTPWALVVMIGVISGFHHESMIPRSHYLYRGSMTDSMRAEAPLERQEGGRRQFLGQGGVLTSSLAIGVIGSISSSEAANALVKGSSPPPPRSKQVTSGKRTCKSIDECEEIGRLKEEELFSTAETEEAQTTTKGDKYRDLKIGNGAIEVCTGSEVAVKYRVLRLGKRSRDGLSGEASPVFSLGYGEDDDSEQDTTRFTVGAFNIVPAINDGILGMKAGGRRRIAVIPERGWKLPNNVCLKTYTDVTIVPGTQVQENDACFSSSRVPTPGNYAARRRMLRRYDETLIVDLEVVEVVLGENQVG